MKKMKKKEREVEDKEEEEEEEASNETGWQKRMKKQTECERESGFKKGNC